MEGACCSEIWATWVFALPLVFLGHQVISQNGFFLCGFHGRGFDFQSKLK